MFKEYGVTAEDMFGPPLANWTPSTPVQVPPQELIATRRPAPGNREDIEEMTAKPSALAFAQRFQQMSAGKPARIRSW
jgi:hypothetical protein